MNYDKLTETLRQHGVSCVRAHGRYCSICDEAATALFTLRAENEKLRAELENYRKGHCAEGGCAAEKDRDLMIAEVERLQAELEQVKRERDAAKSPEVLEAVDELMEFAWTRMSIGDWLYYVNVLGEWRGPQKED